MRTPTPTRLIHRTASEIAAAFDSALEPLENERTYNQAVAVLAKHGSFVPPDPIGWKLLGVGCLVGLGVVLMLSIWRSI